MYKLAFCTRFKSSALLCGAQFFLPLIENRYFNIFSSQISPIVLLKFYLFFFPIQFESATSGSVEASGTDDEDSSTQFSEIAFDDWKQSITSKLPSWLDSVSVFCSSSYLEVQERVRPFVFFVGCLRTFDLHIFLVRPCHFLI
jgi:hypothetical protein